MPPKTAAPKRLALPHHNHSNYRIRGESNPGIDRVPGALHVVFRGALVPDGQAEDVPPVQARVRDEELAARVHALEDGLVLLVRALTPETDDREGSRRTQLPPRFACDPALEQLGQSDRLPDSGLQAFAAVAAEDGPELERAEATTERG